MLETSDCDTILAPEERLDDLLCKGRKIIQNVNEFCFSIDAVLLAHYPRYKKNWRVLDLGTGTGVIPLLIADEVREIHAVEINPVMADLAKRNVEINGLPSKIHVKVGDYRNIKELYDAGSFDCVVANPPYRPLTQGNINALSGVAKARHEITATLNDVVKAASCLLRYRGRFAMVHLPERLGEIMVALHENRIEAKRMRFVQPKSGKAPSMILLEGVFGGSPGGLQIDPPLVVHNEENSYTDEILHIYGYS